jgi:hypothetical protein
MIHSEMSNQETHFNLVFLKDDKRGDFSFATKIRSYALPIAVCILFTLAVGLHIYRYAKSRHVYHLIYTMLALCKSIPYSKTIYVIECPN